MAESAQVRLRRVYETPDPRDGQRVLVDRLQRYQQELRGAEQSEALDHLRHLTRHGTVTLLTATRDIEHSQAAVLAEWLRGTDGQ
jgi:uncharacterized protein YeaO (DUF488 family)